MKAEHLSFCEQSFIIEFILQHAKNIDYDPLARKLKIFEANNENEAKQFCAVLEVAFQVLSCEELRIFNQEFLLAAEESWWLPYYSRASYYRIKKQAMTKFLNCLHQ